MTTSISASLASIIFVSDLLSFSSALCDHVSEDHFMTQDLKTLYSMHLTGNAKALRCNWFTQIKRAQETYHLRKHELQMKSKIKQKTKELMKQQEEIRLVKKRAKRYTCRRCKHSIKFDSNIKLHEHIRIRHAKKSKTISFFAQISESKSVSQQSMISSFISVVSFASRSIIFSSLTSSKFLFLSMLASEIVRERSKSLSSISSIATPKKPIFWTEIVSRPVVASKFSRLSIATSKSIYNILKKSAVTCSFASFISSRTSISKHQGIQKPYLIVNDLYHMFAEKSSSFDLQRHQMRPFFSKTHGNCSPKSNCDFIQSRITSYFHAMISSVFKSIKFEAFASTHVSMKHSIRISFSRIFRFSFSSMRISFSTFSRSSSVCRHCQERFVTHWSTDWVMSSVSRVENNEIFMKQRYWSFASSRSTLRKYWPSRSHYFEKVLACCLLFTRSLFLLIVDRSERTKNCCCCCFIEFDVPFLSLYFRSEETLKVCMFCCFVSLMCRDLSLLFRLDLTRLIIVSFFTILET